jgi:acyl carrier protein
VLDRQQTIATIREIILTSWPHRFDGRELPDDVSLGDGGLGLDSVELAEVLLTCEERCGRHVTEELFATVPLTIASVADFLAASET